MKTFGIILLIMLAVFAIGVGVVFNYTNPPEHVHEYGKWENRTEPTCTEAGVQYRVCECNAEETREVPATGHKFGEWQTKSEPTCDAAGEEYRACACGAEETREGAAATGHSFGDWQTRTEPTCEAAGVEYRVCTCGTEETREGAAATGHSFGDWHTRTEPTCEAAGEEYRACACGKEETNELAAKGHSFGDWATKTPANCTDAEVEYRVCACGKEETREGDSATGHTYTTISASCNAENPMEKITLKASDFTVTATCGCGESVTVTEGITLENSTLVLGTNTVVVNYGELSTTVLVDAAKFNMVIAGTVKDDTYVYSASGSQEKNYVSQPELSANGDNFRVLLRYNFSDVIGNEFYSMYKDEAKVQFTFTMTTGSVDNSTKFTFKVYPVSDVRSGADFSTLTWKNYSATYTLGWGEAYGFVNKVAGDPKVSIDGDKITITVTYRELEEYIDADGNAIFVFAIWKSSTKVGSMENDTEANRPTVNVIFNDEHAHAYIEQVADEKYLVSANCEEKAKYHVSCSCGEAGTATFAHGEVIEHSYSEWLQTQAPTCTVEGINSKTCENCGDVQTEAIPVIAHGYNANVTAPTCTEAGYTTYTCSCGDTYTADQVPATGHTYGEWLYDESYHWQACACGDVANKATHEGGEATETEQAVCDTCKQPYGGLASHVHNHSVSVTAPTCTEAGYTTYTCACGDVYTADEVAATGHTYGEWETVHPATCEGDEVLVRYCDCGESETGKGAFAFGHDMQTKFDENNHWTECAHNCGKSTEPVAHFGGEATETEQAICEGCGQHYGELKPAEKQEYTINGTIVEDTYVASDSGTAKKSDYSTSKNTLGIGSKYYRAYFKFNISDVINSEDFDPNSTDAKIQFVFTLSKGSLDSTTEFTLGFFTPGTGVSDVAFSEIYWNNISSDSAKHPDLKWDQATNLLNGVANSEYVEINGSTVTITFNYSQIADYVDANGNIVLTLRTSTTGVSIASMENTTYAIPAIKYVYYK